MVNMGQAAKASVVVGASAVASTRMSTRRTTQQHLQSHVKTAKKRRHRATDKYMVYEAYSKEVPTERIARFTAGMKVEAVDTTNAWYRAEVLNVDHKKEEVLVHFVGYDHRFNQIMAFNSPLIRPAGRLESLARSLRILDRGRSKQANPSRRREPSPPWRLPGMEGDVDPTKPRIRRQVQKFTPADPSASGGEAGRSESPVGQTISLDHPDDRRVGRGGGETTTPVTPNSETSTSSSAKSQVKKKRGGGKAGKAAAVGGGAAAAAAAVVTATAAAATTGGSGGAGVNSPTRRALDLRAASPRRAAKTAEASAAADDAARATDITLAASPSVSARPSPRRATPKRVKSVANRRGRDAPPTVAAGAAAQPVSRKHPPIKLRISLTPTVTTDGELRGAVATPVHTPARTPLRTPSGSASASALNDESFVFEFPVSPKFVKMEEVKEIITPEVRTIRPSGLRRLQSPPSEPMSLDDASAAASDPASAADTPPAATALPTATADEAERAEGEGAMEVDPAVQATTTAEGDPGVEEDLSDEVFAARHRELETKERVRYEPLEGVEGSGFTDPSSPYAVIPVPQRTSANTDPARWAGLTPFPPRAFDAEPSPHDVGDADVPSPVILE
eukprot:m.28929 g.28929  ORF g.28929 m.28929 type:complete len:620 (+) comp6616_c0_seq1:657-2516(+)